MKRKEPKFIYPFKDEEEEKQLERLKITRFNFISNRNSKVSLVETDYPSYRKLELKEAIYIKKSEPGESLGKVLYLRPFDQVRKEKLIDFVASINKEGRMFLTIKDRSEIPLETSKKQGKIILFFYEHKDVSLKDAVKALGGVYKNTESLRSTINKINRKVKGHFKLTNKDKFIGGDFTKERKGYSFNSNIRIEIIDERAFDL